MDMDKIEKIILKIAKSKVNIRAVLSWISFLPTIALILYVIVLQNIISNKLIKDIIIFIILIFCQLNVFYSLFLVPFILCTPKSFYSELPKKIKKKNYNGKIIAVEIKKGFYNVILEHEKEFIVDMRGWIFKRTYIRDILLMYYHLDFYNKNKLKSKKCLSKKLFPNENIEIMFKLISGKEKKLWLIKNGKEKRSIICDWKIFITCTGALELRNKFAPDKHRHKTIETIYF